MAIKGASGWEGSGRLRGGVVALAVIVDVLLLVNRASEMRCSARELCQIIFGSDSQCTIVHEMLYYIARHKTVGYTAHACIRVKLDSSRGRV